MKAMLVFAPGQLNVEVVDGILVDKTSKMPILDANGNFAYTEAGELVLDGAGLGSLIVDIYSLPAYRRFEQMATLLDMEVAITLTPNANAVFWGLNIQSRDEDIK